MIFAKLYRPEFAYKARPRYQNKDAGPSSPGVFISGVA